jgi:hypothetical protein
VKNTTQEALLKCKSLSISPNLFDVMQAELHAMNVVGIEREAALLFLAIVSRVLARPISVVVKGTSSAGKSFLVEQILKFFPPEAFFVLTAMSDKALAYSEEPLVHRMLVIYEAVGMGGEMGTYLIRSLLSEGCIRYELVEKTEKGMKARQIIKEGPTGTIITTTNHHLNPKMKRGCSRSPYGTPWNKPNEFFRASPREMLRASILNAGTHYTPGLRPKITRSRYLSPMHWPTWFPLSPSDFDATFIRFSRSLKPMPFSIKHTANEAPWAKSSQPLTISRLFTT